MLCRDCGREHGNWPMPLASEGHWHRGSCGLCGQEKLPVQNEDTWGGVRKHATVQAVEVSEEGRDAAKKISDLFNLVRASVDARGGERETVAAILTVALYAFDRANED